MAAAEPASAYHDNVGFKTFERSDGRGSEDGTQGGDGGEETKGGSFLFHAGFPFSGVEKWTEFSITPRNHCISGSAFVRSCQKRVGFQ